MFAHFKGKLAEKNPTYAVIECGGVGYHLNISLHTFSQLKDREDCKLFAHLVVREDAQILYGFSSEEERNMFRYLISVSGVGANTAILILSSLSLDEIYSALIDGNASVLQSVKGIGAKSAQRLILELRDKLKKDGYQLEKIDESHNTMRDEALTALTMLGFNRPAAEKVVNKILRTAESTSVEAVIKQALKLL